MNTTKVEEHFRSRVPEGWFEGPVQVDVDEDEILCTGTLAPDASVDGFRESTRDERMAIAGEAEARFGRKVSWAVERDGAMVLFSHLKAPVMTRLNMGERKVLDTLIEGGVARNRSQALAWCVRLVARHEGAWLAELREALAGVEHVRREGPTLL